MQIQCRSCPTVVDVPVTDKQIKEWRDGALIQDAMPNLSPEQREMLKTRICSSCWTKLFAE